MDNSEKNICVNTGPQGLKGLRERGRNQCTAGRERDDCVYM